MHFLKEVHQFLISLFSWKETFYLFLDHCWHLTNQILRDFVEVNDDALQDSELIEQI